MEIRDLKIFQTVANTKSITDAAKKLNYVQSNVTARIQQLEKELSISLFHRHKRGIILTNEGQRFLQKVNLLLVEFEEIRTMFLNNTEPTGTLNIGTVDTAHPLPMILATYHKKYPQVQLSLKTDVTKNLLMDVIEYRLDGAFVTGPIQHPLLKQYVVSTKKLVLVSNRSHFTTNDLINQNFLVFNTGCGYRAVLEKWLKDENIINNKFMEFNMLEMILHSVALGLGLAILPESSLTFFSNIGNIYCHEIPEQYGRITTVFIRNNKITLSQPTKSFLETVQLFQPDFL
ncbi:LysR family transcriptional regulator [Bacillus cereus]|uniref:HTH-type transcriptional regulator CzcR n=1 Tax=Bacillus cereus TaxID=1396 RepID=A0A9X7GSU0_BACCE|nr:LysR family transcriptional regulator [Bacillus cereus]PGS63644.1 LysR family transcriptional regulator [Bacillus cereus]